MLDAVEGLGNRLPPRLKAILNLAITATLVVIAVPLLWLGTTGAAWSEGALGLGLLLLAVFNLFT